MSKEILSDKELLDLAFAGALGAKIDDIITEEERLRLLELLLLNPIDYVRFALGIIDGVLYELQPVQKLIIKAVLELFRGKLKVNRLIINIPPGVGKTSITVWGLLSWYLTINSNAKILHISRLNELVLDNSDKVRAIIESDIHKFIFGIELSKTTSSKSLWETTDGGAFKASPTFGQITGFRAGRIANDNDLVGLLLIDDPQKPNDMFSPSILEKSNEAWKTTFRSRRASNEKTPVLVIMQRLGEKDFTNYLINESGEEWIHLKIPVYYDPKTYKYNEGAIEYKYTLPKGSIFKSKFSDEEALKLMSDVQYSQEPKISVGTVINTENIEIVDKLLNLKEFYIYCDTASKVKHYNDYTVFNFFAKTYEGKIIDIATLRERIKTPYILEKLKKFIKEALKIAKKKFIIKTNKDSIGVNYKEITTVNRKLKVSIEDKDSGVSILQLIEDFLIYDPDFKDVLFQKITRKEGKYPRALRASKKIEDGYFTIWKNNPLKDYIIKELSEFTENDTHPFDDVCDTVFDVLNYEIKDKKNKFSWDY